MNTYNTISECRQILDYCAAELDLPLSFPAEITIKWNNRMTSTMGKARNRNKVIELSSKLWERATPEERFETVAHEFCHLAVAKVKPLWYTVEPKHGHGLTWSSMMLRLGLNPERYHYVDTSDLRKKPKRYTMKCACSIHQISGQRYSKIKSGQANYKCKKCGVLLHD